MNRPGFGPSAQSWTGDKAGRRLALRKLLPDYPDIKVEIVVDYGLTDIMTEQVSGYHLYYPSRRPPSPAFAVLVAALRYPGK